MNVFFLKQVISALMIFVNLHSFRSIHCLLAFSTNPFITHWRLKRRKTYERLVLSFYIVSFVLNVIVFVRNGLKQSLILQTKPNRLFQIHFFHKNLIYVYLKKASCAVCGEIWAWVCNYISHIRLHLLRKHGFVKKTCVLFCQYKFVYFLETTMYECSIFWINVIVRINF